MSNDIVLPVVRTLVVYRFKQDLFSRFFLPDLRDRSSFMAGVGAEEKMVG